ncbi:hypothetical protein P152DRAFT_200626 [Eremomyces bilateralis CBS 781.70]|uniref:Uncharacterized protein n=1 Tax=Eremomyces bilateralis CBS 781.70 TaxID=1392243 RepID=A0A6G1GCY3_9PEZI|nr:uncharacterized protein P152DRAFT_200626 [Eremomyces bilateralis CBS 781.70]KAF1815883.1 hypothetical protein P152DRAFT_200626 [Eremomyces bilateralis CBS 781.70]
MPDIPVPPTYVHSQHQVSTCIPYRLILHQLLLDMKSQQNHITTSGGHGVCNNPHQLSSISTSPTNIVTFLFLSNGPNRCHPVRARSSFRVCSGRQVTRQSLWKRPREPKRLPYFTTLANQHPAPHI